MAGLSRYGYVVTTDQVSQVQCNTRPAEQSAGRFLILVICHSEESNLERRICVEILHFVRLGLHSG